MNRSHFLRPVVLVLAAGRGSRFAGQEHKLAQPFGGSTVLQSTLRRAQAAGLPVLAVTTQKVLHLVRRELPESDIVLLPEAGTPGTGMGFSIAAGVSASAKAPGWLVLPGDMPLVRSDTLQRVADALQGHAVAYARVGGDRGHPVGFGAELFSELARLQGDDGARRLIARYPALAVDVNDAGARIDIDTADDLRRARQLGDRPQFEDTVN